MTFLLKGMKIRNDGAAKKKREGGGGGGGGGGGETVGVDQALTKSSAGLNGCEVLFEMGEVLHV